MFPFTLIAGCGIQEPVHMKILQVVRFYLRFQYQEIIKQELKYPQCTRGRNKRDLIILALFYTVQQVIAAYTRQGKNTGHGSPYSYTACYKPYQEEFPGGYLIDICFDSQ